MLWKYISNDHYTWIWKTWPEAAIVGGVESWRVATIVKSTSEIAETVGVEVAVT